MDEDASPVYKGVARVPTPAPSPKRPSPKVVTQTYLDALAKGDADEEGAWRVCGLGPA